jgi:flagellar biosynthesis protein FlhG
VQTAHHGRVLLGHVISIGGGKGGVGKSLVACNLAVACAQLGKRVVLADLDLGAANQHLLLGVARPRPGVQSLLDGEATDVRELLTPTSIPNLSLLSGTGAVLGAADISLEDKHLLLRKLRLVEDVLILDVGAGVGYNALDFFLLATQKLLVTTPQVTAIHDAYAFLKGAALRTVQQYAERAIDAALLEPALLSREGTKVVDLLNLLRVQKPELAEGVFGALQMFGAQLIGNQLTDPGQVRTLTSVSRMMQEYLGLDVPVLGHLRFSARIHASVNERKPLALSGGAEARAFRQMADALLSSDLAELEEDFELAEEDESQRYIVRPRSYVNKKRLPGVTPTPPPMPAFPQLHR